jgi:3-oxoacyl-[acyl-carrier protein] reductase
MPTPGLTGKTVLVTGGSRGIGAMIVRRFAQSGARVGIGYRTGHEMAQALAAEVGNAVALQGDVARPEDITPLADRAADLLGGIDILVNCAATGPYRLLGQMDAAFVRAILDTNVMGTVLMTQAVLRHMPAPGGRIINLASALAYRPIPASSVYAASKGAIVSLTHAFAKELGPKGITVNAVAPGVIETEMTTAILAERGPQILAMTPLGRIGQPDDIAGIVTFLASDAAGWITGRTIIADGGVT